MLGYIRRSTYKIKSLAIRRTLYLSLVRSQLGYASQVWAPQSIELIARLERIQRRASKYILDLPFISNTTYSDRLNQLQPLPFAYWLEYLYLIFSFECVNGIFDLKNEIVPNAAQTNKATRSTTDVSCLLYETKLCNTSTYQSHSSLKQFEPVTACLNNSDQILIHYLRLKAYFSNTISQH